MSRTATVRKSIEAEANPKVEAEVKVEVEAKAKTITAVESHSQSQSQPQEEVLVEEQSREEVIKELVKNKEYAKMSKEELIKHFGSKSAAIRGLNAELGWKPGPISKALGILYQHARNVLLQPLKRQIAQDRAAAAITTTNTITAAAVTMNVEQQ